MGMITTSCIIAQILFRELGLTQDEGKCRNSPGCARHRRRWRMARSMAFLPVEAKRIPHFGERSQPCRLRRMIGELMIPPCGRTPRPGQSKRLPTTWIYPWKITISGRIRQLWRLASSDGSRMWEGDLTDRRSRTCLPSSIKRSRGLSGLWRRQGGITSESHNKKVTGKMMKPNKETRHID